MKLIKLITPLLLGLFIASLSPSVNASLASDLTDGQHVLLMRHADAPGYGDPKGYQLDKCATQRNLGNLGKEQSALIGDWLKSQGITSAKVLSSPWCRCLDTAQLLQKGSVTSTPALGSFFDDMSLEKRQTQELEKLIQSQLNDNPAVPLILVTHHVNIQAFTGKMVDPGDMVLVKIDKNGKHISHQVIPSPRP